MPKVESARDRKGKNDTKRPFSPGRGPTQIYTLRSLSVHFQKIIHRDIKPSNLLLGDNDRVRVADFGVCNEFDGSDALLSNTAGTPAFIAPEALRCRRGTYSGKAADMWSMGITLYALVMGDVPFRDENIMALYHKIQNEPLSFPDAPRVCDSLKDLIAKLLHKDPGERLTLPRVKEHEWVTRGGKNPLPSEEENCTNLVEVTEEEVKNSVRSIPKLDTLILVKSMIKKHSFQHPFKVKFQMNGRSNSAPGSYDSLLSRKMSLDAKLPAVDEKIGR
ncbi:unnamed protein product [Darwinula stevensoni]|uniref:Protein kinase domain-containing protein n=1 Tax=Darwinula stevensoni TaxID=69355 RepID=A0A7R9AD85_9CRUS|nr:unnamed protein product [Darwinula stevensoni]CAG0901055.1 unnamed protein product [Darwinula stevensoni]